MPDIYRSWLSDTPSIVTTSKVTGEPTYISPEVLERRRSGFRYNEKQQRVKPVDLIAGMTALPRQYFYDETPGHRKYRYSDSYSQSTLFNMPCADIAYHEYGKLPSWDYGLKVRKKIERLQVNLGTSIVEYRQTADMFKSFADAAGSAAYRIRKLRKYRDQPLHAIAGHYLGYSYGMKPIAQDLGRSIGALVSRLERPIYRRITTRKRGVYKGVAHVREFNSTTDFEVTYKRIASQRVVCYYKCQPRNQWLTLGSWPEWVWEVTPFSHVIDWGFNVGEWLGSLDALEGIENLHLNYSEKVHYHHTKTLEPWEMTPGTASGSHDLDVVPNVLFKRHYFRDVSNTVPPAQLPHWKPSDSWWTVSNAVATLAQCIPGRHMWQNLARHKNI